MTRRGVGVTKRNGRRGKEKEKMRGSEGSSTARTNGRVLTGRTKDLRAGRRLGLGA